MVLHLGDWQSGRHARHAAEPNDSVTLPGGYDYKGLLGAVRNDGSSNFVNFFQRGNHVTRERSFHVNDGDGSQLSRLSLLQLAVPPNATAVDLDLYFILRLMAANPV